MKKLFRDQLVQIAKKVLEQFEHETGQIKVAIGGPPHSGKTVLVGLLRALLPRDKFVIVEAAPDGEGVTGWSFEADDNLVKSIRRKGKFTDEWVEKARLATRNSTAPITLVDLGGMMLDEYGKFDEMGKHLTPANETVMNECDHLIIIASPKYEAAVSNWINEARRLGVKPLCILESILKDADDKTFDKGFPLRARITKLERTKPPMASPTAAAVCRRLLELVGDNSGPDGSEKADVNFPLLSQELGEWTPDGIPTLLAKVSSLIKDKPEVRLWGNCSAGFPYHVIACNFLDQRVRYYDPKVPGFVPLPSVKPQGQGNGQLDWQVHKYENCTFVEFVIPGQVFDVFDLPTITPPEVDKNKMVVLSGKGPWWLTGTILRAYAAAGVTCVAAFAPRESARPQGDKTWADAHPGQAPAIVIFAKDSQSLGHVVPFDLPK